MKFMQTKRIDKPPTEQQVIDMAAVLGIPENKAKLFYHHYNAQGWVRGNGQKITCVQSMLMLWQANQYRFDNKKQKLLPIPGRTCSTRGCGMPAVYKETGGAYDNYRCVNHLPQKVREKYG